VPTPRFRVCISPHSSEGEARTTLDDVACGCFRTELLACPATDGACTDPRSVPLVDEIVALLAVPRRSVSA
jgi:hypothetical protein